VTVCRVLIFLPTHQALHGGVSCQAQICRDGLEGAIDDAKVVTKRHGASACTCHAEENYLIEACAIVLGLIWRGWQRPERGVLEESGVAHDVRLIVHLGWTLAKTISVCYWFAMMGAFMRAFVDPTNSEKPCHFLLSMKKRGRNRTDTKHFKSIRDLRNFLRAGIRLLEIVRFRSGSPFTVRAEHHGKGGSPSHRGLHLYLYVAGFGWSRSPLACPFRDPLV